MRNLGCLELQGCSATRGTLGWGLPELAATPLSKLRHKQNSAASRSVDLLTSGIPEGLHLASHVAVPAAVTCVSSRGRAHCAEHHAAAGGMASSLTGNPTYQMYRPTWNRAFWRGVQRCCSLCSTACSTNRTRQGPPGGEAKNKAIWLVQVVHVHDGVVWWRGGMHLQQGPHIDSLKLFLCAARQATRR